MGVQDVHHPFEFERFCCGQRLFLELDGPVDSAVDLAHRLARSQLARQSFVRHAFRFWMGRNETLNDAPVLQEAYRAYKDGGGSMKALLVSLLTSDAFLYRKRKEKALTAAN